MFIPSDLESEKKRQVRGAATFKHQSPAVTYRVSFPRAFREMGGPVIGSAYEEHTDNKTTTVAMIECMSSRLSSAGVGRYLVMRQSWQVERPHNHVQ